MHKEIRPTDVQWLAEGWWKYHFRHKTISNAKTPTILGITAITIGLVLLLVALLANPVISFDPAEAPSWIITLLVIGIILILVSVGLFATASSIESRERERFVDHVCDRWEEGNTELPDTEDIAEYLKHRELLT